MSEVKAILEMIESVSPDDADTMDEIDGLVQGYISPSEDMNEFDWADQWSHFRATSCGGKNMPYWAYTRSRDALKAIRPEGLAFSVVGKIDGSTNYRLVSTKSDARLVRGFDSPLLPTEELAELHAIIQAIEWEVSR